MNFKNAVPGASLTAQIRRQLKAEPSEIENMHARFRGRLVDPAYPVKLGDGEPPHRPPRICISCGARENLARVLPCGH